MKNITNSIRNSLLKRQEALNQFMTKKEAFLLAKGEITRDIEEARDIWIKTLELLPHQEFDTEKSKGKNKQTKGMMHQGTGIGKSVNQTNHHLRIPSTHKRINP